MNNVVYLNETLSCFKLGLAVPIPKPHKDCTIKNNNRGITLLSTMYKLFEKIMITRESKWFEMNIEDAQSARKKKNFPAYTLHWFFRKASHMH